MTENETELDAATKKKLDTWWDEKMAAYNVRVSLKKYCQEHE